MNNDPTQPNTGVPTNPSLDSPRRVAVIGVHGVAHHDPGATANDMADLLLSLPSFDPKDAQRSCAERPERQFDHFETAGIQVPLQPVCVKDEEKVKPRYNQFVRWFQEGSARFARGISGLNLGEQRGKESWGTPSPPIDYVHPFQAQDRCAPLPPERSALDNLIVSVI